MSNHLPIPKDYPVQPLAPGEKGEDECKCLTCGLRWDDAIPTSMTPVPSARCPFECFHTEEGKRYEFTVVCELTSIGRNEEEARKKLLDYIHLELIDASSVVLIKLKTGDKP